jgi:hypothetical protein
MVQPPRNIKYLPARGQLCWLDILVYGTSPMQQRLKRLKQQEALLSQRYKPLGVTGSLF